MPDLVRLDEVRQVPPRSSESFLNFSARNIDAQPTHTVKVYGWASSTFFCSSAQYTMVIDFLLHRAKRWIRTRETGAF